MHLQNFSKDTRFLPPNNLEIEKKSEQGGVQKLAKKHLA